MTKENKMSNREKRLLILTLGAILIVGPTVIMPMFDSGIESEIDPDAGLNRIRTALSQVESQLSSNQTLRDRLGNPETRFVAQDEVYKLLAELEQVGGQSGLQVKSQSQGTNLKSKPLPEVTVQIDYQGRYPNVVQFLEKLERMKIPVFVRNLRLTLKDENSGEITGTIKLTSYLLDKPKHIGSTPSGEGEKTS